MLQLKILLLLIIFAFKNVKSECTTSESDKLSNCSAVFFNSLGIYQGDMDTDGIDILSNLMSSWENIEKFCKNFDEFKECLGHDVIKNCINREKDLQAMNAFIDVGFSFIYTGGNFVCGEGYDMLKHLYTCALEYCEIDNTTCQTLKTSMDHCSVVAKHKCDEESIPMLQSLLNGRECFNFPDCEFCDRRVAEKIKQYRARVNATKKVKGDILKGLTEAAQSMDIDLQLEAITKITEKLTGTFLNRSF